MIFLKKHIPNLNNLQSFICCAKHKSFTQAATELHLTQSAISRQIKELEKQLGTPLFHRIKQRVFLTDSGTRFLVDAKKILYTTEEAMLRTMSMGNKLSLNIAALPTFTSRWLIPKLHTFMAQNPEIVLNFQAITQPFDFDENSADIAIHFGKPNWPKATCYLICKERMIAVASKEYLARHSVEVLTDINTSHLLHLTSRLGSWNLWFEQHSLEVKISSHLNFDQFSMIIDAMKANLGIALLPEYFISKELEEGTIQQIGQTIETKECYYLVIPEAKQTHAHIILFQQWLVNEQNNFTNT